MPLDKKKLMSHLTAASKAKAPATPAKAAEKIEQDVKKATGVSKVEKEAEQATKGNSEKDFLILAKSPDPTGRVFR